MLKFPRSDCLRSCLCLRLCRAVSIRPFVSSSTISDRWARPSSKTDVNEADIEATVTALMSGQYNDPLCFVAFNTVEHWGEDVSKDIAREIMRRVDLAGDELPSSLEAFVDRHLGPDRQLTMRLG